MTDDYTPTTETIRARYADGYVTYMNGVHDFDHWLAEYTRQQREEAWDQGRDSAHWVSFEGRFDDNPYREGNKK